MIQVEGIVIEIAKSSRICTGPLKKEQEREREREREGGGCFGRIQITN